MSGVIWSGQIEAIFLCGPVPPSLQWGPVLDEHCVGPNGMANRLVLYVCSRAYVFRLLHPSRDDNRDQCQMDAWSMYSHMIVTGDVRHTEVCFLSRMVIVMFSLFDAGTPEATGKKPRVEVVFITGKSDWEPCRQYSLNATIMTEQGRRWL